MNYLLDTNIASYAMRRRPSILEKIEEVGGLETLSISTITLAELMFGILLLPGGRRKDGLSRSLEEMLVTLVEVRPFSPEAAEVFSKAGATLRRVGIAFSFQDLAIASIAIAENKTLASNDGFFKDVERLCGLRFERWDP